METKHTVKTKYYTTLVHVEKELTVWYPYMNELSWIYFDDVDSNPYRNGNRKDNFRREVSRDEIHDYVKSFFYANEDDLYLDIMYGSTKGWLLYISLVLEEQYPTMQNRLFIAVKMC